MVENKYYKFREDEIDAMDVTEDWPISKGQWICIKTGEQARVNPLDNSVIGCLSCNFRTRYPAKIEEHFIIEKIDKKDK